MMLEFTGSPLCGCHSISRRPVLKAGSLALGGLGLPNLLRQRAHAGRAGTVARKTSVIFLELAGGPPQFKTYDPKPDAAAEYRGPLGAIGTGVPGVLFGELMVEQTKIMDKLAIVRSIHHDSSSHGTSKHLIQTGFYKRENQGLRNEMPSLGSITAKIRGANAEGIPPYVMIPEIRSLGNSGYGGPSYLGMRYHPLETKADPNDIHFQVQNLSLSPGLTPQRLTGRQTLLHSFDAARRVIDTRGASDAMDHFSQEAFDIVFGQRARRAFNIAQEDPRLRDQYGRTHFGQNLLLARRLVEAGVTLVTVRALYWDRFPKAAGGKPLSWDFHADLEKRMKIMAPGYDRGMAALVSDLHARGLDRDVLVVAMGDPRVNADAGRDHWGALMSVLFAGGGLQGGQIVGTSNKNGEMPVEGASRPENVLATIYHHLGIDPAVTFPDFRGRPRYVLERSKPVAGLV